MFLPFFENLRESKIPVSLREYLTFLEAVKAGIATYDIEAFYYLARSAMVKDERNIDKFDRAFAATFKGLEDITLGEVIEAVDIPADWLEKMAEKHLSQEERDEIKSLGGFEKLMETLKERLKEQEKRHQGGSKWIGTAGTSPFGAFGYNPEGVRIGQNESRHRRAVKVWDKREFKNLDDTVELGTRNIKVALKRLRQWARDGAEDELDLDGTIKATAENGYLDVKTRPERRNAVKVLLFLDVGGSMDSHIKVVEELFSAARPSLNILNTIISITVFMRGFGVTTPGAGMHKFQQWTFYTPMDPIINASLSAMRACHLMRLPTPVVPTNIGMQRPVKSGCSVHKTSGKITSGLIRYRRNTGVTHIPSV